MRTLLSFGICISLALLTTGARADTYSLDSLDLPAALPTGEPVVEDGDSGLSFCHTEKWSAACLYGLFVYRCTQYAFPLTPYGCTIAASSFVDMLDMKRVTITTDDGKTYNLPVIFTTKIVKLIQTSEVQTNIRELLAVLKESANEKKKFDFLKWVQAKNKGNKLKTLEWIAVLLQDTSPAQLQIAYLDLIAKQGKFSEATKAAIDDLSELCFFLSNENLTKENYRSWLTLYPHGKNLDAELTPLIYHFYPMSYLALRLQNAGYGSRLGSLMPFLFNTEYELQSLDPEMWPLRHPRPEKIDLEKDYIKWKMRDMYGGMAGALWGVNNLKKAPGLVTFQKEYAKSPFRTMQYYFWFYL